MTDGIIDMAFLMDPIAPAAAQKFLSDCETNSINFDNLQFIMLDSIGTVVKHVPHNLQPKNGL